MNDLTRPDEATLAVLQPLLARQRAAYDANPMPSAAARREDLARLKRALLERRHELAAAVSEDFGGRSPFETLFADVMPSINAINHTRRRLRKWMRPRRRHAGLLYRPARAQVFYQPLGVVGVMVPWNYPVLLALGPLVSALAAGNRVMLKLSELMPATNAVMRRLLAAAFAEDQVAVVEGERAVSEAFSRLPFDHLLFTGSTEVGRQIMRAASEHLTPVTLELGGKCPAIIHPEADLEAAAERLAFGKGLNAGQTCISVDYVLCPRERLDAFLAAFERHFRRMYPRVAANPDYTGIVSDAHYARLVRMREEARAGGARLIELTPPGEDLSTVRKLPLTLVLDTDPAMQIRQAEIFGPLLPVLAFETLEEALAVVRAQPRPLALYYFDPDRRRQDYVLAHSHSGSVCINDTIVQIAQDDLPFGGVGASGMGAYHGIDGFETFSKAKAVLRRGRLNLLRSAYPPFRPRLLKLAEWLLLR